MSPEESLEEVRDKRKKLRVALVELENALSSAAGRPGEWAETAGDALEEFAGALERHIAMTERGDGLFAQVMDQTPRLAPKIARLRTQHDVLAEDVRGLLERCRGGLDHEEAIEQMRQEALDLLGDAARHRQLGADLLYEAYEVDIAASD